MTAVRNGAWVALKYVTTLFFVGVIAQFFLVGYGLFDMAHGENLGETIDNAKSLDAHRALGFLLSDIGAGLMLILVLLAWPRARLLVSWIVLAVLAFVQAILAGVGYDNSWVVGMFHPVNALVLLGLSGHLARYAWKNGRDAEETPAATVTA
jgi:hypothetical protein